MATIIIALLGSVLLLYFVFSRIFRRGSIKVDSYSVWEILNPFNKAPKQIYSHLSPENKGAFWSLTASIAIGVLTCWLGFSSQYLVYNFSQDETKKMAHYEVVDKFRPKYFQIIDTCSEPVLMAMTKALGYKSSNKQEITSEDYQYYFKYHRFPQNKINSAEAVLASFVLDENNWGAITHTAEKIASVSGEIAPYLNSKNGSELLQNNAYIILGRQLLKSSSDRAAVLDSLTFVNICFNELVKASVHQEIMINTKLAEVCAMEYSMYRKMIASNIVDSGAKPCDDNDNSAYLIRSQTINKLVITPMIKNLGIIQAAFTVSDNSMMKMFLISFAILLLAGFLGYVLMRIIVMKFFDRHSLKPNPQLSQTEVDKLMRQCESASNEATRQKIDNISLLREIQEKSRQIEDMQKHSDKNISPNQDDFETGSE